MVVMMQFKFSRLRISSRVMSGASFNIFKIFLCDALQFWISCHELKFSAPQNLYVSSVSTTCRLSTLSHQMPVPLTQLRQILHMCLPSNFWFDYSAFYFAPMVLLIIILCVFIFVNCSKLPQFLLETKISNLYLPKCFLLFLYRSRGKSYRHFFFRQKHTYIQYLRPLL